MLFRIDSHQRFTATHPPEHFGPILARNKFAGSVCVMEEGDPADWADFDCVLAVVARGAHDSWRCHPKFRGVLVAGVPDAPPPAGETLDLMVRAADLPAVLRLAESAPESKIVIDHFGGADAGTDFAVWSGVMEQLAHLPHVYVKASGMVRSQGWRPFLHHLLRCFGGERVMFGSGWPDCLPEHAWKETLAAFTQALGAAPIPLREELLGGAAARFYGIAKPVAAEL